MNKQIDFAVHGYTIDMPPTMADFTGTSVTDDSGVVVGEIKNHDKTSNKANIILYFPVSYSSLFEQGVKLENIVPIYEC